MMPRRDRDAPNLITDLEKKGRKEREVAEMQAGRLAGMEKGIAADVKAQELPEKIEAEVAENIPDEFVKEMPEIEASIVNEVIEELEDEAAPVEEEGTPTADVKEYNEGLKKMTDKITEVLAPEEENVTETLDDQIARLHAEIEVLKAQEAEEE